MTPVGGLCAPGYEVPEVVEVSTLLALTIKLDFNDKEIDGFGSVPVSSAVDVDTGAVNAAALLEIRGNRQTGHVLNRVHGVVLVWWRVVSLPTLNI